MTISRTSQGDSVQPPSPSNRRDVIGNTQHPPAGSPQTPHQSSPRKRKRTFSAQHKQALIDNLQLEITERARRLRAQYNLQAQGLRSRIEIRINRVPSSLRKARMGDLVLKLREQEKKRVTAGVPPPVPAKDAPRSSPHKHAAGTNRSQILTHKYAGVRYEIAATDDPACLLNRDSSKDVGDKENDVGNAEKTRARVIHGTDANHLRPTQVLSPTSPNSRLTRRELPGSPTKSHIARPGSPLKRNGTSRSGAVTNVLSTMVERAKASRNGGPRVPTPAQETGLSKTGTKNKRNATVTASRRVPPQRPATRNGRRASGTSETSEGSTATVIRKTGTGKAAAGVKKTTMGAIRKGVTGVGARKAAAKAASSGASAGVSGRVLRKRG